MNPIQDSENMDPTRTKKRNASAQSLATATQKKHQRQGEKHPLSDYAAGSITKIVLSNTMKVSRQMLFFASFLVVFKNAEALLGNQVETECDVCHVNYYHKVCAF